YIWNNILSQIPPPNGPEDLPFASLSVDRRMSHLDVFWVAPDGSVQSNWWDQNANNGAWLFSNIFKIAPPGSNTFLHRIISR
ncbi:MAG: hypothetical protein ACJ71R_16440, partial [Nitrososphaeraceae archaeon]